MLARRGLDPDQGDPEESDPFANAQPGLAAIVAASGVGRVSAGSNAGGRVAVAGDRIDPESLDEGYSARCASVAGFSLHANTWRHDWRGRLYVRALDSLEEREFPGTDGVTYVQSG